MKTPPQIVYMLHGEPTVQEVSDATGRCYVCGGPISIGIRVSDWLSTNFTDQNRARTPSAKHVCGACIYVQSRTAPVLGRPPGDCRVCEGSGAVKIVPPKGKGRDSKVGDPCPKCGGGGGAAFGGNFRNYCHLWEAGWKSPAFGVNGPAELGYVNASKGEKPLIREFLRREHAMNWFAALADSGQKHVLPFAPMNARGRAGMVLFDEQLIRLPGELTLLDEVTELLTDGITKDEIESGTYYVRTMRERRDAAQAFEAKRGRERGSGWFTLALWLAQRDEEEHERRSKEKEARDAGSRDAASAAKRVPARAKRATSNELLDPDPRPSSRGCTANSERERVGKLDAAKATDREPSQGRLPGFG